MKKLFLVCAIGLTLSINAQELKQVTYNDGTQQLNGMVTSNAGEKRPGVLILPAWKGIGQ